MGCICSRESSPIDYVSQNEKEKEKESNKALPVQLVAPSKREEFVVEIVNGNKKPALQANQSSAKEEEQKRKLNFESPKRVHHQRRSTVDLGDNGEQPSISKIASIPGSVEGKQIAAGWPSWLASVAGEAINGWVPRNADSFEKIKKIGQGTYSSVYKARDLDTGKIVAMKKVRFVNMDPESVRFMAREICILRRLDHPNVMKLECLVTSRISGSLYLVFEYMEHDLAGLAASPKMSFSEPQIKCYMQQLFCGLEHCHSRGILHRDIKGSNLLINNDGILKIGDFGLATFFQPDNKQPMTSRVVTLWYRAPELLLGATEYGVAIDLWSTGCILAELFAGKPIMPGRTEVEQMHKIFKLCGSPSAEYWKKTKFPHTTSFKPQNTYRRCVSETFKDFPSSALSLLDTLLVIEPEKRGNAASALNSVFFSTKPLPCVPSSLPKYPPSKEFDAKLRNEEARRRKAEAAKERPSEYFRGDQSKGAPTPEFDAKGEVLLNGQSNKSTSVKYNLQEDSGTGFRMEPPRGQKNEYSHSSSMIHPSAAGYSRPKKSKDDASRGSRLSIGSSGHGADLTRRGSHPSHGGMGSSSSHRKDRNPSTKESMGYAPKRNRILCSGPLMPPGSNLEDMLKEHERQIQEAVRKSRLDKARTKNNCFDYVDPDSLHQRSIHRYN